MVKTTILRTDTGFDVTTPGTATRSVPFAELPSRFGELGIPSNDSLETSILQLAPGQSVIMNKVDGDWH